MKSVASVSRSMEVNCEGCAGCCVDWRPVSPSVLDHERRGPRRPVDDVYNLVPLDRDEVVDFLAAGYGDALVPRLWRVPAGDGVTVDGVEVAALDGRPAFFVGLKKTPKPVSPFGVGRTWLRSCVFLDPDTLQCRIHDDDLYPSECAEYPGHNLVLDEETECERVERAFGTPGERLVDDERPAGLRGLLLGPHAVGGKVFIHPDASRLEGVVDRLAAGTPTREDCAEFVAVAVGSRPGSADVDDARVTAARKRVLEADSWVGKSAEVWAATAGEVGSDATGHPEGTRVEGDHGAPETPGW